MRRNHEQLRTLTVRRAMTLVELLIVGAVIAILAALTLTAVSMVATTAKITKTRATIQKIDVAMQQIFEEYEERFLLLKNNKNVLTPQPTDEEWQQLTDEEQLRIAVHCLRDIMRMEMPQCWAEVSADPTKITLNGKDYVLKHPSPLLEYYLQHGTASSAELLFLIIQNLNPEALEAFHGSEIADTDGNGLLEFVDAWGKPIRFLRWAPAFTDSDLQPNVQPWGDAEAAQKAKEQQPFLLGLGEGGHDDFGWFLYPLIYSAGPDGEYGIDEGDDVWNTDKEIDPCARPAGIPDGTGKHFDNIHNHRWFRSF